MKSKVLKEERIENKDRKFGECKYYFPVKIYNEKGEWCPGLFTEAQIEDALKRGHNNPEDVEELNTFLDKFFDFVGVDNKSKDCNCEDGDCGCNDCGCDNDCPDGTCK